MTLSSQRLMMPMMVMSGLLAGLALAISTQARTEDEPPPFRPKVDRHGVLELPAAQARLRGERLRLSDDRQFIADWVHLRDRVDWIFLVPESGRYAVVVEASALGGQGGGRYALEIAGQVREGVVHATGRVDRFLPQPLKGAVELEAGPNRLVIRAIEAPNGFVMNLRRVRLVPAAGG